MNSTCGPRLTSLTLMTSEISRKTLSEGVVRTTDGMQVVEEILRSGLFLLRGFDFGSGAIMPPLPYSGGALFDQELYTPKSTNVALTFFFL